ncbi:MAG: histone deacetylase [Nitrospirae bacterium]|nr:MAG: histone deacetylase [Nitrospirota bacterium]
MARTGLVYHADYLQHDMGLGHPESPQRLRAIIARLEETGLLPSLVRIEPHPATDDWVTQVHTNSYVKALRTRAPHQGYVSLDPDTSMSPGSLNAAYLAAGGVLTAIDAIMDKRVDNAFCAVRPPGHHAEADHAMGFCLINNVAVAARYFQKKHGLERIAIVDWDVHHGNGTQHTFYKDPSVFFFSTHQYPYYPGTGAFDECGEGKGEGYTLNVPLSAGKGDPEYLDIFNRVLRPALTAYKPDAIIISAGFDAHRDDPLAGMNLTDEGYKALTKVVKEIAGEHAGGRVLSCLEGGYNLAALAASVEGHLRVLQEA